MQFTLSSLMYVYQGIGLMKCPLMETINSIEKLIGSDIGVLQICPLTQAFGKCIHHSIRRKADVCFECCDLLPTLTTRVKIRDKHR